MAKWGFTRGDPPPREDAEGDMPEELKGKTPGEIAAELKTLRAGAQEHETTKAAHVQSTAALQRAQTELETAQAAVRAAEANRGAPPAREERTGPTSVLEDEDKAFAERLGPIVQNQLANAAVMAKSIAEGRIRQDPLRSRLLTKYQSEVDKLFETVPFQYRQFPETFERVVNQVIGAHAGELITKDKSEFFIEPGGGAGQQPSPKKDELTPDELDIAKKMKIPPAEYLKNREMLIAGPQGHVSFAVKE